MGKWKPFMIISTAPLKILVTWYFVYVATNGTQVKRKDDLKTALMNTDDQQTDPSLPPYQLQFQTFFFLGDNQPLELIFHLVTRYAKPDVSQGRIPYRKRSNSWTQRYKQTKRNLILCLTQLYLMYYIPFFYLVDQWLVYFNGLLFIYFCFCDLVIY